MVMSCQGSRELPVFDESWQRVSAFPCLGHILQDNGSIRACFSNTTKSMWRAYWGNSRHSALQKAAHNVKFKLLDTSCRPALSYRCSRWPPQPCMARSLDRIQAKMVAAMLRIPRLPGEDGLEYVQRRNREAAGHCRRHGLWSSHWFKRAKDWQDHIERGHSPLSWSVLLRPFHDHVWLDGQRIMSNFQGTSTRLSRGRPCTRWHEGIELARRTI